MPKTFSDSERAYIREKLLEEATECLGLYGIRKTTVDELVKRVKIPKGTFYLFYTSKELLFYDVFCALHDETQKRLLNELSALKGNMDADGLTKIFFSLYKSLDGSFLLKLITGGELELLFRKLPPELVKQHAKTDDFRIEELVALVPNLKDCDVSVFSAALRGIFISMLHKREIGEEVFDEALLVMLRGVVSQMFQGGAA